MAITSSLLLDAAQLSLAAYDSNGQVPSVPSGWVVLTAEDLGINRISAQINIGMDAANMFQNGNNAAYAAFNAQLNEVAIVYRGSNGFLLPDYFDAIANQRNSYVSMKNFSDAVIDYARNLNSRILATGHSLGGALAQCFANLAPYFANTKVDLVTFASPGYGDSLVFSHPENALHLSHTEDPVSFPPSLFSWISGTFNEGPRMITDLPLVSGQTLYNGFSGLIVNEHKMENYKVTSSIIRDSESFNSNFQNLENHKVIIGTNGSEFEIYGSYLSDYVMSGFGNDNIYGGSGSDILDGGSDVDYLYGQGDVDYLWGSAGGDYLYGGGAGDYLYGGVGVDYLRGEASADFLWGGSENDTLFGDEEVDTLHGEGGNDTLNGGSFGDFLYGDSDSDTLIGEGGNDTLDGGTGAGTDTAVYAYDAKFYRAIGQNALDFQIQATQFEEGTDRLIGIEQIRFKDQTMSVGQFLAQFVPGTTTPPQIVEAPTTPDPVAPSPPTGIGLPKLHFNAQSFSEGNSGSRLVNVLVTLDKPATSAVTFLFTSNAVSGTGSATAGSDFEAFYAKSVTIAAGQSSVVIPVRIYGDTKVEGNELFNGMVSNLSGAVLAQGGLVDLERMTIVNDDATVVAPPPPPPAPPAGPVYLTLRQGSITLEEGQNGVETVFEFDIRKTGDMSVATRFRLSTEGFGVAPATANDFAGGVFPTLDRTISAGSDRYSWQVRIQGDVANEPNEYFKVMLDAISSGVQVIEDTSIGVIINDDGATPPPPGGGTIYVSVNALDAVKAEGTNVTFDPVDNRYESVGYTIYTFEVTRSGDLSQTTSVKYRALTGQGGTPQSDSHDLDNLTRTLTFNPGEASRIIEIRVRPDNENEPDEAILVRITPDNASPNVEIVRGTAQGTIINDDGESPPLITPVAMIVRETEADQTVMFRVNIAHAMSVPVTMTYNIGTEVAEDYASVSGEDFLAATGTLTIPAGALFAEIPVTIRGNAAAEGLEVVMIKLSNPVNGYFGRSLNDWDSGIIITDNDAADPFPTTGAEFEAKAIDLGVVGAYDFKEVFSQVDAATPTHIYKITLDSEQALMIFSDGSAQPKFLFDLTGKLVHAEPSRFDEIQVMDLANGFARGTTFKPGVYYLVVEQGSAAPDGAGSFRLFGAPPAAELPLVWIEGQSFSYNGPSGAAEVAPGYGIEGIGAYAEINLSSAAKTDVVVTLAYRPISATVGSDFSPVVTQVIIPVGDQSKVVSIDLGNDALFEGAEQFEVVITGVVGGVLPNHANEQSVLITVLDDETNLNQDFDITATQADRAEGSANGGTFIFTVTRPIAFSAEPATIDWNVLGSGAAPASAFDFAGDVLPSGTLTFAAGESSRTITITTNGDRFAEVDETFRVILSQPSTGFDIGIAEATGIIRNDDGFSNGSRLADGTLLIGTTYAFASTDVAVILTGGIAGDLQGNALANTLAGNNAINQLTGLGGNDSLFGYQGNDVLNGGTGADRMFGGNGNDIYHVDNALDSTDESGGNGAKDTVYASVDFIAAAGIERLFLTGQAHIRATGSDSQNDLLTGNAGNNVIDGLSGTDTLNGGDGNDTLRGGAGGDVLNGGIGSDFASYYFDAAVTVALDGSLTATGVAIGDTFSSIENISGSNTGNDIISGNASANRLNGNGGKDTLYGRDGADTLSGGDGDDTLRGGAGGDVLNGGIGSDFASYYYDAAVTVALDGSLTATDVAIGDTFSSIENISGSNTGNDIISGNASANRLNGNGGKDTLYGRDGADTLSGGDGDDTLRGGAGGDVLNGGIGSDFASYYYDAAVTVALDGSLTATGVAIGDTFSSIENISGSNTGNDIISGNASANRLNGNGGKDTLYGRDGADTLSGGDGDDTLRGGAGGDVLNGGIGSDFASYYYDAAVTVALDGSLVAEGTAVGDTFTSIEHVSGSNTGNDTIAGDSGANQINGNGGDDTLQGREGNDILRGGLGNDMLSGNADADQFVFDTALNATTNVDTISTVSSLDRIVLDNDIFTALGTSFTSDEFRSINTGTSFTSVDATDNIIYLKSTGQLFYDRDGNGSTYSRILFADLTDNTVINHGHFLLIE